MLEKYLNKILLIIQLIKLNKMMAILGMTIVTLLLAGSFFCQTENISKNQAYGQGYNIVEIRDSEEIEDEEEAMEEADEDN